MAKSDVYSWRVSPATRARLEDASRREGRSMAAVLDDIVSNHLASPGGAPDDGAHQRTLHARAARFAGAIRRGDPHRSARVRQLVRSRLKAKRRAG